MNTLEGLIQGSPKWLAVRAKHFTASEAVAMLGFSPYMTRNELLRQKATGIIPEPDAFTLRLFDEGHKTEAQARPIVERMLGEDLFPVTATLNVDGLPLLASLDGITMLDDCVWEHKLWNTELVATIQNNGDIPESHWPQLEQQLLISGAELVLFTVSDGTADKLFGHEYRSVPERRALLIAGWKQFAEDLAQYQHVQQTPTPIASAIEALPALVVQVEGRVISSNLTAFKDTALAFLRNIKTDLQTDQDFADAERNAKHCKEGEERLELVKQQALAQTASIDELFRTIDVIKEEMRSTRLNLEKSVKSRKDAIRLEVISKAHDQFKAHISKLNQRLGGQYMPTVAVDFAGAIKGKKSISSLQDAADTELAHAKITANEIADRVDSNLKTLDNYAEHGFLFADKPSLVLKADDDLRALIKNRIADHQAEQARQLQAEHAQAPASASKVATEPTPRTETQTKVSAMPARQAHIMESAESIVLDFIDAYQDGSKIHMEKVYKRAKAAESGIRERMAA